ncbi:hypothetical protein [Chlorogloea sp. CCALA 695]|uniref:hypothetical protein n=1 Tax=Chlorogloea sp. CCALA 695 TaxID=2107693 RepID=UPI000D068BE2|nr:hypothetical protein [Chlorogloea sp. CCALA 695]PSB26777.1 hypothetical protein C7B70_23400 [Chlorogloea sp. CCALA 695]
MQKDIQNQYISRRTEVLIKLLLLGKFDLGEVAMITGISQQLLQNYLSTKYMSEYQQVGF